MSEQDTHNYIHVAAKPLRHDNVWATDEHGNQRMYHVWWVKDYEGIQKNVVSAQFRPLRVVPWKEGLGKPSEAAAASSSATAAASHGESTWGRSTWGSAWPEGETDALSARSVNHRALSGGVSQRQALTLLARRQPRTLGKDLPCALVATAPCAVTADGDRLVRVGLGTAAHQLGSP